MMSRMKAQPSRPAAASLGHARGVVETATAQERREFLKIPGVRFAGGRRQPGFDAGPGQKVTNRSVEA